MNSVEEIKENLKSLIRVSNHNVDKPTINKVFNREIDEVLCEKLPFLSVLYSIISGITTVSDNLFYRKIITILYQTKDYSESDYNNLIKEFRKKGEDGHESLLFHIDKLESIPKCKVFGNLLNLYFDRKISFYEWGLLKHLILTSNIDELHLIKDFKDEDEIWEGDYYYLISNGLIFQSREHPETLTSEVQGYNDDIEEVINHTKYIYYLSELGLLLGNHYQDLFKD